MTMQEWHGARMLMQAREPPLREPQNARASTTGLRRYRVKKVVLAYSGGLDTSVAVAWLREQYGAEVVTLDRKSVV